MKKDFCRAKAVWALLLAASAMPSGLIHADEDYRAAPPRHPRIPNAVILRKLDDLDQQIAKINNIQASTAPERYSRMSTAHIRLIAHQLLEQGIAIPEMNSYLAAVYGLKLVNDLPLYDDMFRDIIAMADGTDDEINRAKPAITSLERFLETKPASAQVDTLQTWADIHHYLTSQLSDLLVISDTLGHKLPENPWLDLSEAPARPSRAVPVPAAAQTQPATTQADAGPAASTQAAATQPVAQAPRPTAPSPVAEKIESLLLRAEALKCDASTRTKIKKIGTTLRDAIKAPQFAIRVAESVTFLEQMVVIVESLDRATWISSDVRNKFDSEMGKAVASYIDPRQRRLGINWLDDIDNLQDSLNAINLLKQNKLDTSNLDAVFLAALRAGFDEPKIFPRSRILGWLTPVTSLMAERFTLVQAPMPDDMRFFVRRVEQDVTKIQLNEISPVAREIGQRPEMILDPKASAAVASIQGQLTILRDLVALPKAMETATRLGPKPPLAIVKRMKSVASRVGGTDGGDTAAVEEIHAFVQQVRRYSLLPGEKLLRSQVAARGASAWASIGRNGQALLDVIDQQRSSWVNAWASDKRPAACDSRMRNLARLMRMIRDLEGMRDTVREAGILNRWPCIEIDGSEIQPYVAQSLDKCKGLVDEMSSGGMASLTDEKIEESIPPWPVIVLSAIHSRYASLSVPPPADVSRSLAVLLYAPAMDSWMSDHAEALAYLSFCVNEKQIDAMLNGYTSLDDENDHKARRNRSSDNEKKNSFLATLMFEPNRSATQIISPEEWMDMPID